MEQLRSLVPDAKWPLVEKALRQTFGSAHIDSARLLTGGLSSALVYYIGVQGQGYVLRVVMQSDMLRDPARHYHCLKLASDAGIAPTLHYADAQDGISISTFIEGAPFPPTSLLPLIEVVKSIHTLPLFPPLINFLDGVDGLIQQFQAAELLPATLTEEHFALYAQIQRAYPRHDPDVVSSHNDLNPGNLLYDGQRFWVVDWEVAFRNDRYVDLAVVGNVFITQEADEDSALQAYFGDALNEYHHARFFLMRQVCRLYQAMLLLNHADSVRTPESQVDQNMATPTAREFYALLRAGQVSLGSLDGLVLHGKVLLNEALRAMQTDRFDVSIRRVSAGA